MTEQGHPKHRPIRVLDPNVAERIAAGEVIERPASVVKELIENSLDAGATEIAVILEDGGKALIEVIDNGHGMDASDLALSVQPHATSKLASLDDLERIQTLGFRGEALASIAAVADVSLLSRAKETETAYELRSGPHEPRPLTFGHFLNSKHGTKIQAQGLFSQVPARLKFLKSQGAEVSQVREWMERLALAHPETGFRLVSNDRPILSFRPQMEIDRVRAILGDGEDFPVISEINDSASLEFRFKLRVHWVQGLSTPQSRKVIQIVNGRAVRDRMLQQALLSPFRQALLPGQFPAVALYLEIAPSEIDVNVHPTKTEIRFLDSRKVFHTVESLVQMVIEKQRAHSFVPGRDTPSAPSFSPAPLFPTPVPERVSSSFRASEPLSFPFPNEDHAQIPAPSPARINPIQSARWVNTVFHTYLIYEIGDELVLIDQHAAHERIRYEKLRERILSPGRTPGTQSLLLPEAVHFRPEVRTTVGERLPILEKLGFEVEIFGEGSLLFRGIPTEWGNADLKYRLKNLVDRLIYLDAPKDSIFVDETLFERLASEACHSSVRAGDALELQEAMALVEDLFRCIHPWNCPHGRPTVVRVPRLRFEEWFQRKI